MKSLAHSSTAIRRRVPAAGPPTGTPATKHTRRGSRPDAAVVPCAACAASDGADNDRLPIFSMSNKPRPADIDEIEEYIRMTLRSTVLERRETFSVINVDYDRVVAHFATVTAIDRTYKK